MIFKIKRFVILILPALVMMSCLGKFVESDVDKILKENEATITTYASKNALNLTKDPSTGIYYRLLNANPTGQVSSPKFDFYIAYSLGLLNGTQLEKKIAKDSTIINLYGTQLFDGFLASMLLLKEGEKGQFLIPSYLAYAESPPAGVSKNEVILLEIELLKLFSEDEKIDLFIKRKKLNVTEKTTSGLRFIRTNEPTKEDVLKTGDVLSVKYNGMYINETSFDSGTFSYTIGAGNVIAGFSEGLGKLKKGEKAKLVFPSTIGYGTTGNSKIPPYAPLIFDVEILTVNGK
jgi:FKBP-type peptidyl-prolyl cis-trans isomerase